VDTGLVGRVRLRLGQEGADLVRVRVRVRVRVTVTVTVTVTFRVTWGVICSTKPAV